MSLKGQRSFWNNRRFICIRRCRLGLADVFIDAVTTRNIQIVFESHSEHLLKRLQRRIAEEQIAPEMTALYFCEPDNGGSKLTPLDVDLYGRITNWLEGFFGDQCAEMAETAQAMFKRQQAEGT